MAFTVYPSENDIAAVADEGRIGTEISHKDYAKNWIKNYVLSGFTLPATTSGTLVIDVASGACFIEGRRVQSNAIENPVPVIAANDTNHLFVTLSLDGDDLVDAVSITSNTTGALPANSVKIGRAITDATEVTSTFDDRDTSPIIDKSVHGGGLGILVAHKERVASFDIPTTPATIPGLTVTIPAGSFFGRSATHRDPLTPHLYIQVFGQSSRQASSGRVIMDVRLNGTIIRPAETFLDATVIRALLSVGVMIGGAPLQVFDPDIENIIDVQISFTGLATSTTVNEFMMNIWDTGDGPRF